MSFLPCTYGYATTIRRAQGATYRHGAIWFDHDHPPDRGYGYVAASRFKAKDGMYLFGKVRRTDWLPVRETAAAMEHDQVDRSEESYDDYDSESEEIAAIINDGESDRTAYSDYVESDAEHYTFHFWEVRRQSRSSRSIRPIALPWDL